MSEKIQGLSATPPANTVFSTVNVMPEETSMHLPQDGKLWVACEYDEHKTTMYILNEYGKSKSIKPGEQTIIVKEGDQLIYTTKNDIIKLGWAYVS